MGSIKVLLADDHALVRAGLRDALTTIPEVEVVGEAANGQELIDYFEKLQPDLLVMDVNMPEFEPISAIRNIRSKNKKMKILVVSAYDDQAQVVGLLSAGVDGYHLKDQPLSDFHSAVKRILEGGKWISDPLVNQLVDHHVTQTETSISLTLRQRELLYLLTQGFNNPKIASVLGLSIKTIENHLSSLYRAIGVEGRLEAGIYGNHHPDLLEKPRNDKYQSSMTKDYVDEFIILLVDDNPRYRFQLGNLIKRACPTCKLFEAEDSDEAVHIAEQTKPKLAFIDAFLRLRGEDGIVCVQKIKQISPQTHIILISAYPDWSLRQRGINVGALTFLDKKDINAATVREIIEDNLE